jgi:alginate O-acetyltransferase complex protein AlgI
MASYYFYASWNAPLLLLVIGLTTANFLIGWLQGQQRPRRQSLLVIAVIVDLGALAIFKYLGLLDDSVSRLGQLLGAGSLPAVNIILPLGLSFFTFEFIHYQVDLYRGADPIPSAIRFALFPAFFPTQIAGPIKRYEDFDPQVASRPRFSPQLFIGGVELIALGMFKKVVLADNLLPIADRVFSNASVAGSPDAWVGMIAFSFQILLDFSGYTDIGRGSAQLLGYVVPVNFRAPYLATSFRDFWHRWHITLSTWLRDYLYIPLGGSRTSPWRRRFNLMVTMALGGLWHGGAWHYMVWGIGHGVALVANHEIDSRKRSVAVGRRLWMDLLVGWLVTQLAVVLLWSVFRAPSLNVAVTIWHQALLGGFRPHLVQTSEVLTVGLIAVVVLGGQWLTRAPRTIEFLLAERIPALVRPAFALSAGAVAVYFAANAALAHRFIYFQF